MATPNNKSLKELPVDEGFDIFGCQIPQNVVGFCKKFLRHHPQWSEALQGVINEKNYETARLISRNYGANLINLEDFTGLQLANTLENVMQEGFKKGDVTFNDILEQTFLLEKLKKVVTTKNKKKHSPQASSSTSTPRKRTRNVSEERDDSDAETVDSQNAEEGEETEQESEFENEDDANITANESSISLTGFPTTPSYNKAEKKPKRAKKSEVEKKVEDCDTSDSDSFDPVIDDDLTSYKPLGDIKPNTKRLVIKGANKNYYGLDIIMLIYDYKLDV